MSNDTAVKKYLPWMIVLIAMLFYAFNYLLRISPSTMMQPLIQHFHIDAAAFGSMAAFYYYIYVPMQIPAGFIVDRFRVRFILTMACAMSVLGLFVFISANQFWVACLGRFMIGFGCSFAYISTMKLAASWLPTNRFAIIAGLTTAFGMLAGAASDKYLTDMVQRFGYEKALHGILFLGIIIVALLFLIIRDKSHYKVDTKDIQKVSFKDLFSNMKNMCKKRQMWVIGAIACLAYLPASIFLDLWGLPYLTTARHLSPAEASSAISFVFFGWIVSGPLTGMFSDFVARRRLPLILGSIGSVLTISAILYAPAMSIADLCILLFLFGACAGAQPLVFALGRENNPNRFAATSASFVNMVCMLGGVIFQPLCGFLLDWHSGSTAGSTHFNPADFRFALGVLPLCFIASCFFTFMLKETHCRTVDTMEPSSGVTTATPSSVNTAA